jgi:2-phospho-L-lactate guanylyltransferase
MAAQPAIDALVPFKGFDQAKERLAALLSPAEREALARLLLAEALRALAGTPSIRRTFLVSSDAGAAAIAGEHGAEALPEPEDVRGLNPALEAARAAILSGAEPPAALLVLHADIAGLDAAAIERFAEGAGAGPLVRLCPARDEGTNALLLRPPDAIPFRYGPRSALAHEAEARMAGAQFERRIVAALQDDLDTPADVERLLRSGRGGAAVALLRSFGVAGRLRGAG